MELAKALKGFPVNHDPRILVGVNAGDDAGVYLLRDDLALVQTVDFFTPIVDDPFAFGQIAAANALSDVYSMGAVPITALNLIAFPSGDEPGMEVLSAILKGSYEKAKEAGVSIIGGHSVDDKEPKYGMAVTGTVHPEKFWAKKGARPGDLLVLTKPLGTGIIATAIKKGTPDPKWVRMLIETASALNKSGADAAKDFEVHAATDVTGFGLVNHLLDICKSSGTGAVIHVSELPILDGAVDLIKSGMVPGGTKKNFDFAKDRLIIDDGVENHLQILAADAQTSGGLLLSVPKDQADDLCMALKEQGALSWAIIGEMVEADEPRLRLTT